MSETVLKTRPSDWADWEEEKMVCRRKKKYRTLKRARAVRDDILEKQPERILNIYECPFCAYYHIGNRKGGTWEVGTVE